MERRNRHNGTENVLVDLGLDDAEELTAKANLAVKFNELVEKRGLSQMEAAAITGMTQPKVCTGTGAGRPLHPPRCRGGRRAASRA